MPAHKMSPLEDDENGMTVWQCEYCKRKIGFYPHGSKRFPEAPPPGEDPNPEVIAKTFGNDKCDG